MYSGKQIALKRRRSCLICATTEAMNKEISRLVLFVFACIRPYEFTRMISEYALRATSEEVRVKDLDTMFILLA